MQRYTSKTSVASSFKSSASSTKPTWIELNISKLECCKYVPQPDGKCKCGRFYDKHDMHILKSSEGETKWDMNKDTLPYPTDAFGTLEFQGGPHPLKARYVRIHHKTPTNDLFHLLLQEWKLKVPSLVISIIGGLINFDLQPKLKILFQSGLIKAAKTTGAWILTSGLDTGVTKLVGEALKNEIHAKGNNIVALGIAPWGLVQHRRHLIGKDRICPYYSISNKIPNQTVLNKHHNYFLLADNGTLDKYGAEKILRRNLERYLANQSNRIKNQLNRSGRLSSGNCRVPVVAVLVEGGIQAFRVVFDLVSDINPVPVVVCEGSGRAADMLAFMHRYADEEGELPNHILEHVYKSIGQIFHLEKNEIEMLYKEMKLCLKKRDLISIYRVTDNAPDIDVAILTALLQESSPKLTKADQLTLTIAWNRPDIARSQIFMTETDWKPNVLKTAMTDALICDRLEFVKLLMENGINMHNYLTTGIIETLYNSIYTKGDHKFNIMIRKAFNLKNQTITLHHVGLLIELLVGSGYQHHYCHKSVLIFSPKLSVKNEGGFDTVSSNEISKIVMDTIEKNPDTSMKFRYPYTELFQWALLTRRYETAMYMVTSGEESIAKSLFSVRVLKGMKKLLDSDNESEYLYELKLWETKFEDLAVTLQNHCYEHDPEETKRLLCYELHQFSDHTCISLAYLCKSKPFLSHVCTQNVLNDLWYGGLREGRFVGAKVLFLLLSLLTVLPGIPLSLICLKSNRFIEFKTKEELAVQAQTLEEFLNELSESSSSSSDSSESDDSSDEVTGDYSTKNKQTEIGCYRIEMGDISKEEFDDLSLNPEPMIGNPIPSTSATFNVPSNNLNNTGKDCIIKIDDPKESVPNVKFMKIPERSSKFQVCATAPNLVPQGAATITAAINGGIARKMSANSLYTPKFPNNPSVTGLTTTDIIIHEGVVSPDITQISPSTPLSWKKKIHEFFYAPITKFYLDVIAYMIFLLFLIRICVMRIYIDRIDWMEIYTYAYIITNMIESLRKINCLKGANVFQKIRIHFELFWNAFDILLGILSLGAILVRLFSFLWQIYFIPYHFNNSTNYNVTIISNNTIINKDVNQQLFLWGRNMLILSAGGWVLKFLELMQNWRFFGAYIEMIRSLVKRIAPPILILGVIMTSFAIVRQGIMYMGFLEFNFGDILKAIYLKPYFMLYGEVYASEIDPIDFPIESRGNPLSWTVPVCMVTFMIAAVVIILSLIIAGITDIFGKVEESSVKVYMYLRYPMIIEYECRAFLPPPFIAFVWLWNIFKRIFSNNICRSGCTSQLNRAAARDPDINDHIFNSQQKTRGHSAGLKLFLSLDEIEKLHDFEEECVEDYTRQTKLSLNQSKMNDINDYTQYQLEDLNSKINLLRINSQITNQSISELLKYLRISSVELPRRPFYGANPFNKIEESIHDDLKGAENGHENEFYAYKDHKSMHNIECHTKNSSAFTRPSSFNSTLLSKLSNIPYMSNTLCDDLMMHRFKSIEETPPISPTTSLLNLTSKNSKKNSKKSSTTHRRFREKHKRNNKKNRNLEPINSEQNLTCVVSAANIITPDMLDASVDETMSVEKPTNEETMWHAEKMERDEMTGMLMQRLRQLSFRNDESSEEVLEVVREIEAYKSLDNIGPDISNEEIIVEGGYDGADEQIDEENTISRPTLFQVEPY